MENKILDRNREILKLAKLEMQGEKLRDLDIYEDRTLISISIRNVRYKNKREEFLYLCYQFFSLTLSAFLSYLMLKIFGLNGSKIMNGDDVWLAFSYIILLFIGFLIMQGIIDNIIDKKILKKSKTITFKDGK